MLPMKNDVPTQPNQKLIPIVVAILVVGSLSVLFAPLCLWAYSLNRAANEMRIGMQWPTPRLSDSLPVAVNQEALAQALTNLAVAERWRPEHAYAYRLAGQIYLARAAWPEAAASLKQAHLRSPKEPLIAWEMSLAYEQMQLAIEQAKSVPITEVLASGQLNAPGELVRSQFCSAAGAESCYFGRTTYTQTDAIEPESKPITRDVLFLHPPASLAAQIRIPAETPALRFIIGLDPAVREGNSQGARFVVFVRDKTGEYNAGELSIDSAMARRGWISGWADLSRWASQDVILRIASQAEPTGKNADDWYGWADVALTTRDAAHYTVLHPLVQLREAWQAAGQGKGEFSLQRDTNSHSVDRIIWSKRLRWISNEQ